MKLKTTFWVLLGMFSAQSQITTQAQEPVIVTNRNVFKETVVPPQKVERNPQWRDFRGEVMECRSNVLVVRTFVMKNIYGPVPASGLSGIGNSSSPLHEPPPMRPVIGQKKKYGAVIALRNFPSPAAVTNGQEIVCRAMMTGTFVWRESLIELYDRNQPAIKTQP